MLSVIIPLLVIFILNILALMVLILVQRRLRTNYTNWLVFNCLIAYLLFAVVLCPAYIHKEILGNQQHPTLCAVYTVLHLLETCMVPLLLLAFTLERLIFIKDPTGYRQKLSLPLVITMLVIPWLVSFITVTVVQARRHIITSQDNNTGHQHCHVFPSGVSDDDLVVVHESLYGVVPMVLSVVASVVALVLWVRYKRGARSNAMYSQLDWHVKTDIRRAVIIVCALNLMYLAAFGISMLAKARVKTVYHFLLPNKVPFEFYQIIICAVYLTDIRNSVKRILCRFCSRCQGTELTTMHYVANAEEAPE